jgi:diguanylate cyclase (GGDEF)-like protein
MTAMSEPEDEGQSPPFDAGGRRAGLPSRGVEKRLELLLGTIQEFASLRFSVRALVGPDGDIIDAIAGGVNFLGEELEASFNEIERRVADRTAELTIATRELSRKALHDELTGLPNRALFWEHLAHRLESADRRQAGFAVLFLDVDNFKAVNDRLGHAGGDRLLVGMASRLRAVLRAGDTAARVGGDEFLVLLDDVASKQAAAIVAGRIVEKLRAPYRIGRRQLIATASIGVALGPDGLGTTDDMIAAADAAMYDAKRQGGGRCVFYKEELHAVSGHERRAEVATKSAESASSAEGGAALNARRVAGLPHMGQAVDAGDHGVVREPVEDAAGDDAVG